VKSPLRDTPPPYSTIVFDCDSTLSSIEGIEELVEESSPELEELTTAAMNGELPLEAVYGRRLELVLPTRQAVLDVGARYVETALPNTRALIAALHALEKRVLIVSGGLLPAVAILGEHLGVPATETHAVDIHFDSAGDYAGFETDSLLARAGGKLDLLSSLESPGAVALIGDGATDLEAASLCARFVAFGGVVRRDVVFEAAPIGLTEPNFAALLPLLCSPSEIDQLESLPAHTNLVDAAGPWL